MHSIRFKMTAVMIAAILTSILSLGGVGLLTIRSEVDHTSVEKMDLISANEQLTLDAYLSGLKHSVDMVSHKAQDSLSSSVLTKELRSGTEGLSRSQRVRLDAFLTEHCAQVQEDFSSVAVHTSAVESYYYCLSAELSKTVHGFYFSRGGQRSYQQEEAIDAARLDPDDREHNAWYFTPQSKGCSIWVGPYRSRSLNEQWTVSYLAPVFKNGIFIGVMGMDLFFETLLDQVQSLKVYDTGCVCLLNQEGEILFHPELEMGSSLDQISPDLDPERFRKSSSKGELLRCSIQGEKWQLSYSTLSNGMKLVVMAPVAEITQSWRDLTAFGLLLAAAILSMFTVLSLFLMGAITKPLLRLTTASQKLAAGEYDVDLDYQGKDEVGVLTSSFRALRDHLKIYISDLNSRAYKDALTGVKNKGAFDISAQRLRDAIRLNPSGVEFAILMLDCNDLKEINDQYGHAMGDVYLTAACEAICQTFAHSPVFRLGGDEFAVLMQGRDFQNREELLKGFDALLEDLNARAAEPWERVSLSKGLSVYRPGADQGVDEALTRADERMYEEKRRCKSARL